MNRVSRPQLAQYVDSKEIQQRFNMGKRLRPYVVTFIGSRKILFGEIDGADSWKAPGLQLAEADSFESV